MTNDIYQQLGAQLAQRGQQANPYAALTQQRQVPMPQMSFGGGAQGNPYAGLMQSLGRQAQMPSGGQPYGSMPMLQSFNMPNGVRPGGSGLAPIAAQLAPRQQSAPPSPGGQSYPPPMQTPIATPYQNIPAAALDGTGWKDNQSGAAFMQANPYYGQTGYYGDLAQVQAQMAGKAQAAGKPTGVLGPESYTQNPTGQPTWQPQLTAEQQDPLRKAYQSWMDSTGRFLPDDATRIAEAKKLGLTPM